MFPRLLGHVHTTEFQSRIRLKNSVEMRLNGFNEILLHGTRQNIHEFAEPEAAGYVGRGMGLSLCNDSGEDPSCKEIRVDYVLETGRAAHRAGAMAVELPLSLGAILGLYVLIYYNFIRGRQCRSDSSLKGKTIIVTGANVGIGKMTALDMAKRGARVILACRVKETGEAAAYDIRKLSGNNQVMFMKLDLASIASIRSFCKTFLSSEPRLDILINNAGIEAKGKTEDGFNMVFGVNHLGHFLLTHLLLDRLKQCTPSRVVVLASTLYQQGRIDFENLNPPGETWKEIIQAYCDSKLANVLYVRELANKLQGTGVTCYAVHPGVVLTNLTRNFPHWLQVITFPFAWMVFKTPMDGAQTSIYCAVQEGIEMYSGRYFADCQVQQVLPHARDDAVAKKLWEVSEDLLELTR